MHRHALATVFLLVSLSAIAQTNQSALARPSSDPTAIALAQKAMAALTSGASISDANLSVNVISIVGSNSETGTGTFYASGIGQSRVDLSLNSGSDVRTDVRAATNGTPGGAWQTNGSTSKPYAQHNCWTDAAWFFPALSSLSQTANPNFIFSYVGQGQHGSVNAQHIRVYQWSSQTSPIPGLSTMDFYLDSVSLLPVGISFNAHPDDNMGTSLPTEIDFANFQRVNGIQVPFHFQKIFNGIVTLDVTVTSAAFNTGLPSTLFTLQ